MKRTKYYMVTVYSEDRTLTFVNLKDAQAVGRSESEKSRSIVNVFSHRGTTVASYENGIALKKTKAPGGGVYWRHP